MKPLLLIALCACGRFGFGPTSDARGGATDDGPTDDGRLSGDASADGAGTDAAAFDPSTCPLAYNNVFLSSNHRYRSNPTLVTWPQAVADCLDDGAGTHLIVLATSAEQTELKGAALGFPGSFSWVGLNDRNIEGAYQVVTTENVAGYPALSQPPWAANEPNGGMVENCMDLEPGGGLNDADCNAMLAYVCECDGFMDAPLQY